MGRRNEGVFSVWIYVNKFEGNKLGVEKLRLQMERVKKPRRMSKSPILPSLLLMFVQAPRR